MVTGDTFPPHEVIVIADDLTGACDTAVAFSMKGIKTEVLLDWCAAKDLSTEVNALSIPRAAISLPRRLVVS